MADDRLKPSVADLFGEDEDDEVRSTESLRRLAATTAALYRRMVAASVLVRESIDATVQAAQYCLTYISVISGHAETANAVDTRRFI